MALFEFRRADGSTSIRFDSSPQGSICRQYGYREDSFSHVFRSEDRLRKYHDVFAAQGSGKPSLVGHMAIMKPEGMAQGRWCPKWEQR